MADGNPIIDLYRSMTKSSDSEVKNFALGIGFKDFSNKLINDKDFRGEIYYGLSQKGLTDLQPTAWEESLGLYKGADQLRYLKGDAEMRQRESADVPAISEEGVKPEEDKGFLQDAFDAVGSVIDWTKDNGKTIQREWTRGELVQEVTKNASAVDQAFFDAGKNPNLIDFDKVAAINKKIKEFGSTKTEEDFANADSRGITDYLKMAIPTILGSAATLARSGYDEILGSGAAGGVGGLAMGGFTPASVATGVAGLGYGLQAGGAAAAAEMEYTLSVMADLEEKGVDITNPNALRKAWGNRKLIDPIRSDALTRTGIVLLADVTGGIIGGSVTSSRELARKSLDLVNKGRKISKFRKVKDKLVDLAIEGTAGMAGEAGAIYKTKGEIKAKDMPEIYLEGLGEIPAIEVMFKPITAPLGKFVDSKLNPTAPTQAQAAPVAEAATTAPARETIDAKVGQEEYDDFVSNNVISEGRASAVAEDAQKAMQDPKYLEQIMVDDPLYAGMVERFIDKGLGQQEVDTLTQAAYLDTAQFYDMTMDELKNALTEGNPAYNAEISKKFNETFNNFFQAYKEANNTTDDTAAATDEVVADQTAQPMGGGEVVAEAPAQGTAAQVGQVVEIDGKRYYVKDEGGGKLVVETEEGKIYEIPSDNPTIESIGATLLREAQPDKNYGIQVDNNNTATINGEKYVIIRDKQGNITAAKNQRRGNISLTKPEVLNELSRQLADPNLRQLTTVSVQQPLTQVNETVQPEGGATTTTPTQPQQASPEMAGQTVQEGGQGTGAVQPGTEVAASSVGAPVSGVTTEVSPEVAEIEKRRKELKDRFYGRRANQMSKYNPGGRNEELTQDEVDEIEAYINAAKEKGYSAEKLFSILNKQGYAYELHSGPFAFNEYLKARLAGDIDVKVNDKNFFAEIDKKFNDEIAALKNKSVPATPAPAAPALPSFEEYDSNFKGEGLKKGQRMQNKENFSSTYGAEVYEGMRKINDNFTRITDALIKENRLDKKC